MDRGHLILSLRARPENLVHLRSLVADFIAAVGARDATAYDAKLTVGEITTNAILHGYAGLPGEIDLEARSDGDRLVIVVCDRGAGRHPAPRGSPEAGRGIPIAEALAETVEIGRDEHGTRVELTFADR